jgi:hypothetical protein
LVALQIFPENVITMHELGSPPHRNLQDEMTIIRLIRQFFP